MTNTKQLVILVAALMLAVFAVSTVSALGTVMNVEVDGVDAIVNGSTKVQNTTVSPGTTVPVRVEFLADSDATDTRIKVSLIGASGYSAVTERFDVFAGSTYARTLSVQIPSEIDPRESFSLQIYVESRNGQSEPLVVPIVLNAQRESYVVEILDVTMDSKVVAGSSLGLDVVLKNRGSHLAEDSFVSASIPALGIQTKGYFGDLSAVDQPHPDKEDAAERRLLLRIPSDAPAGVYTVEIEAYNGDTVTSTTRKVVVASAGSQSTVVSPVTSKTFGAGETAVYSLTLVNSGDRIVVYDLVFDTPNGLKVNADDTAIAVPAGSSRTVKLEVSAKKAGTYNFGVDVHSNGDLVKSVSYTANVQGNGIGTGNATVLLTVILAIVFVVLLVVLIVLLTRKPKKSEEFGESYY